MPEQELSLGSTVIFRGEKYVIVGYQITHNRDGRSVNFTAFEPLLAIQQNMEREQRANAVAKSLKAAEVFLKDVGEDGPR